LCNHQNSPTGGYTITGSMLTVEVLSLQSTRKYRLRRPTAAVMWNDTPPAVWARPMVPRSSGANGGTPLAKSGPSDCMATAVTVLPVGHAVPDTSTVSPWRTRAGVPARVRGAPLAGRADAPALTAITGSAITDAAAAAMNQRVVLMAHRMDGQSIAARAGRHWWPTRPGRTLEVMQPEPVTATAPRPAGRTVFTQDWMTLTFIHWAVDPATVAPLLPAGVTPDVFDGVTYVGLVPFSMERIGVFGSPHVPYFGSFLETNVRLYGVDEQGRRGVVFCSLEAARLATVAVTRWTTGLEYLWARMRLERDGERLVYTTRRRWPGPRGTASRVIVRVGEPIEPSPLEQFLTARWGLFLADRRGRTCYWPNEHPAWPLRRAELEHLDDQLVAAAGFPGLADTSPLSVLHSTGVHVRFGPRQRAVHTAVTNS